MSLRRELLLYVRHRGLLETLLLGLRRRFPSLPVRAINSATEGLPGSVVVTTTADCPPAECAGIAETGADVVILATFPSDFEHRTYQAAGAAAYISMTANPGLIEIISSLIAEQPEA